MGEKTRWKRGERDERGTKCPIASQRHVLRYLVEGQATAVGSGSGRLGRSHILRAQRKLAYRPSSPVSTQFRAHRPEMVVTSVGRDVFVLVQEP